MTAEVTVPASNAAVGGATLANGTLIDDLVRIKAREVSAQVVSDPAVFALEMERIFDRLWVFVAHESEIPNKGDFVVRYMGLDSVIVPATSTAASTSC